MLHYSRSCVLTCTERPDTGWHDREYTHNIRLRGLTGTPHTQGWGWGGRLREGPTEPTAQKRPHTPHTFFETKRKPTQTSATVQSNQKNEPQSGAHPSSTDTFLKRHPPSRDNPAAAGLTTSCEGPAKTPSAPSRRHCSRFAAMKPHFNPPRRAYRRSSPRRREPFLARPPGAFRLRLSLVRGSAFWLRCSTPERCLGKRKFGKECVRFSSSLRWVCAG